MQFFAVYFSICSCISGYYVVYFNQDKERRNNEEFIENWRFWFAAGKPYKSDEETFAKMVESLKAFYVDGASLKILLNGLYVTMIFHRWK